MHQKGEGVPLSYSLAEKYYLAAANQGYGLSEFNLGVLFQRNLGVDQDLIQAFLWYGRASMKGVEQAKVRMDLVSKNVPPLKTSKKR